MFHYTAEFEDNKFFKEKYKLDPTSPVVAAGIIIGTNATKIKTKRDDPSLDESAKSLIFDRSMNIRDSFLYGKCAIRVYTWDWVLDNIWLKTGSLEKVGA